MKLFWISVSLIGVVFWLDHLWLHDHTLPGETAPGLPFQQLFAPHSQPPFTLKGYTLVPQAQFSLRARVLSVAHYQDSPDADLIPVDLALGWGAMSNPEILQHFDISQSERWYRMSAPKAPISMQTAIQQSANMHMIPANPALAERLQTLREGEVIAIDGWLVDVQGKGPPLHTSLSRSDEGAGACEVVYVLSLARLP